MNISIEELKRIINERHKQQETIWNRFWYIIEVNQLLPKPKWGGRCPLCKTKLLKRYTKGEYGKVGAYFWCPNSVCNYEYARWSFPWEV